MKSKEPGVLPSSEYYAFVPSANAYQYLLYPLLCGVFQYKPGYDLSRECFDSFLLEVILEGQVLVETMGRMYTARQNDVVLIDCYEKHRYRSDTGWKAAWIHFDGASARGYYNLITKANGPVFASPQTDSVLRKIQRLFHQCEKKESLDEVQMAFSLTSALTSLTTPVDPDADSSRQAQVIDRLLGIIGADISAPPSIREMADMAGLSPYYFIRVFTGVMGVTPKQYILSLRMNQARYLLSTTRLEIREIAQMVGYRSESAFCTAFRNIFEMTPREFRGKGLL